MERQLRFRRDTVGTCNVAAFPDKRPSSPPVLCTRIYQLPLFHSRGHPSRKANTASHFRARLSWDGDLVEPAPAFMQCWGFRAMMLITRYRARRNGRVFAPTPHQYW
ncbi:hypothetical protein AB1N83_004505 [Pleurotus pulmonarius]